MNEKRESYLYWLSSIQGIGNKKKEKLLDAVEEAEQLYLMKEKEIKAFQILKEKEMELLAESRKNWKPEAEYEKLCASGIRFLSIKDSRYPEKLKNISAPPFALFFKGNDEMLRAPAAAIVGSRMCTYYGRNMAYEFARGLAEHGVNVVSGLARGIDGYAGLGAVEGGGSSYAVLGCGVDICYPKENIELYQRIQERGGIFSEYLPGTPPLPRNFPARNRIISGLSEVVLVVEAKEKSGSLITADMALEQGKDVYAVPGRLSDTLSRGCNRLIKQGAGIALSPMDILEDLNLFYKKYRINNKKIEKILETNEDLVYSCLDLQPKNMNQLFQELPFSFTELTSILLSLELKGFITETSKNYYARMSEGLR